MKIAFLSFYSGFIPRGVETVVHELASRLALKHGVTVYQGGPVLKDKDYKNFSLNSVVDWERQDSRGTFQRRVFLDYWSLLIKKFTQQVLDELDREVDIVLPFNGGWMTLLCRLWAWRHGAKLVISGQSGPGWDDRINLLYRPDVFVGLTDYQTAWARRNGFGVKVIKIPNGVDLDQFSGRVKPAKVGLPQPIFLAVAALEPGKRLDLTIRAVAKLDRGSLLVLGDGKSKTELATLAVKLLPGRYQALTVPHDQIPGFYAAADVVTMVPPRTESFGIVFLEAMASGKPVVTSDDPARQEIVGSGGLFVNPKNTQEYATALQKALEINWGDRSRKQAEKFDWDKIAKQYDQVFRNLTDL